MGQHPGSASVHSHFAGRCKSQASHQEPDGQTLVSGAKNDHMRSNSREGELRVAWESNELLRNSERAVVVVLHKEGCALENVPAVKTDGVAECKHIG